LTGKGALKNFEIGSQRRSEILNFVIAIFYLAIGKAATKAPHRWKLRENCLTRIGYAAMVYSIACLGELKGGDGLGCLLQKSYRPCSAFVKSALNFHLRHLYWFPNCQSDNREALEDFKGFSQDGERMKFAENLCTSPFNKVLSNDTTFSQIHFVMNIPRCINLIILALSAWQKSSIH
jgi:hypothetical protein